jgi:glutamate formiminotransferase
MSAGAVFFECVINVSEGRDGAVLDELSAAAGAVLLDRHCDPDHHRSVFTLAGARDDVSQAARDLARAAVRRIDLRGHSGVHPRLGALDVVPFVPYLPSQLPPHDLTEATALRDDFARWCAQALAVPSFLYGPLVGGGRTLPEVRRRAFDDLTPDFGPALPHPTAGAAAVGARTALVAYNVWVNSLGAARHVAPLVRGPHVRSLGMAVGDRAQVSCNLIEPTLLGPAELYDDVARRVAAAGGRVVGAELVGLIPEVVLRAVPKGRWTELDLSADTTVESRIAAH